MADGSRTVFDPKGVGLGNGVVFVVGSEKDDPSVTAPLPYPPCGRRLDKAVLWRGHSTRGRADGGLQENLNGAHAPRNGSGASRPRSPPCPAGHRGQCAEPALVAEFGQGLVWSMNWGSGCCQKLFHGTR